MTKREIERAEKLLAPYAERFERAGYERRQGDERRGKPLAWCLTVIWRDGNQKIFYTLDSVEERVQELERDAEAADPDVIMTIRVPASLHAVLSEVAEREERTIAAVVRLAIKDYLGKAKK